MSTLMRVLLLFVVSFGPALLGSSLELFGKGSFSKNYHDKDSYTVSVSGTAGLAVTIFSQVRLEGRYTNISSLQNKLEVVSTALVGTLKDYKTEANLYTVGLDIDLLGEKSFFQPFIYLGAGYIEIERSYYFTSSGSGGITIFHREPKRIGISGNVGLGFKIRIAKSLAFEVEAYGYGSDIDKPSPLVNLYGTAGIRLYL